MFKNKIQLIWSECIKCLGRRQFQISSVLNVLIVDSPVFWIFFLNFFAFKSFLLRNLSKMKPLRTVEETLTWLCVCEPSPESTSSSKVVVRILFSVFVFVSHVCGIITHLAYVLTNLRSDPKGSVFAFDGAVGYMCATYILIIVYVFRIQIGVIFEQLTAIYDARKPCN